MFPKNGKNLLFNLIKTTINTYIFNILLTYTSLFKELK